MKVISIDPGYDRLGIAVIEKKDGEKETLLYSECIVTDRADDFYKRLNYVVTSTKSAIKKYSPAILSIETLYFTNNQKTAMRVAETRGAIIQCANDANLKIFEYTPLQVKVAIGGHGRSEKTQIIYMLPKLIDLGEKKIQYDDEYDAIAIGLTCLAIERFKA